MLGWPGLAYWLGLVLAVLVALVNLPLLWTFKSAREKSLINQMIRLDCLVALLHIPFILKAADVIDYPCWIKWFFLICLSLFEFKRIFLQ